MATKAVQGKVVAIYVDGMNASPFLRSSRSTRRATTPT